jgi:TonB family protein
MTSNREGALNLLGQAWSPLVTRNLPAGSEPRLDVSWGAFHQGVGSSLRVLMARTGLTGAATRNTFFKDCWIERRIPRRAIVAAALWHFAFIVLPPIPGFWFSPRKNTSLDNFQLSWSGPIEDLPLVNIPKQKTKTARPASQKVVSDPGADAYHPRQRIYTDPVHPTHLKQTLINPSAPFEAPKMLPDLPNIVQLQQAAPPRPRLLISEETLKKLRPQARRLKTVTTQPPLDAPTLSSTVAADMSLPVEQNGPARPKLEINAGAAPRVAERAQSGESVAAPDVDSTQVSAAGGGASTLIALSATPGPAAPVQPPQGNLAAKVSISPDRGKGGAPEAGGGGTSPVGVSISGGNPKSASGISGLGGPAPKLAMPSVHAMITKPMPKTDDEPDRVGPPDFAALPPGAKPEQVFAAKHVYTMNVNMPNLNSATGSWILNFTELRTSPGAHITSSDLAGPVAAKKVDPKYPQTLIDDRVEGEVVLYAVIRKDGSVDSVQMVRSLDDQLDANAMDALKQWKFRPATKQGEPIEVEAIVHIPFHIPTEQ